MYQGRAALITGASSGLGEAFARAFASGGASLLLAARSEERLRALAAELAGRHGVRVEVVPVDLAERAAATELQAAADALDFEPDLLVNNAGVGALARFGDTPLERQLQMVHLNVEAVVALTGLYLPRMATRGAGAIVNVASAAALQPIPYYAVYGASKAFVLSFSAALRAEYRSRGVRVLAVCPGSMPETRFAAQAHRGSRSPVSRIQQLSPSAVVDEALRALARGQPTVVPGRGTKAVAFVGGALPRRLQLILTERMYRGKG